MAEKDLGHLGTYDTDSHTVSGPLGRLTVDRDGSVKDLDGNPMLVSLTAVVS